MVLRRRRLPGAELHATRDAERLSIGKRRGCAVRRGAAEPGRQFCALPPSGRLAQVLLCAALDQLTILTASRKCEPAPAVSGYSGRQGKVAFWRDRQWGVPFTSFRGRLQHSGPRRTVMAHSHVIFGAGLE